MFALSEFAEQTDTRLKVVLVDDHLKVLESETKLLGPDYRVVAAVNNGAMALKAARELRPDLIVLDIEMPGMDGIQVARQVRRMELQTRIFFLTVHDEDDYIAAAHRYGDGYILKSRMATDLRLAIKEAFCGRFFVSRRALAG